MVAKVAVAVGPGKVPWNVRPAGSARVARSVSRGRLVGEGSQKTQQG